MPPASATRSRTRIGGCCPRCRPRRGTRCGCGTSCRQFRANWALAIATWRSTPAALPRSRSRSAWPTTHRPRSRRRPRLASTARRCGFTYSRPTHRASPLENPRQVPAYRYSRRYGLRPPCFARATKFESTLFIGGTASIIGEDSRHAAAIVAQTEETLSNLRALIAAATGFHPIMPCERCATSACTSPAPCMRRSFATRSNRSCRARRRSNSSRPNYVGGAARRNRGCRIVP